MTWKELFEHIESRNMLDREATVSLELKQGQLSEQKPLIDFAGGIRKATAIAKLDDRDKEALAPLYWKDDA